MLHHGLSDWTRIDVDARSLADPARRAAQHRRDDIESILPAACGGTFERKNRRRFSSTGERRAWVGVPSSRKGALDGDLVMISSQYSPLLAEGLSKGKIDAAFLRREKGVPGLAFRLLVKEPLMVILPSDHHLTALKAISPRDLEGETFVIVSGPAPVLRAFIDNYLKQWE